MDNYFNTTNAKEAELREYRLRAKTSAGHVYRLFMEYEFLSPWQAYGLLWKRNGKKEKYPITSIRRAFDTLAGDGFIEKTGQKRTSPHTGAKEYIYHRLW